MSTTYSIHRVKSVRAAHSKPHHGTWISIFALDELNVEHEVTFFVDRLHDEEESHTYCKALSKAINSFEASDA